VTGQETVTIGAVSLDVTRRRAFRSEEEIVLTATEFELLAYLMRRPGRVLTRDVLLSEVWGYSSIAGQRTVDVHIAQLRAKFGHASPIRTVRGVGYSAESPP
jgi:DNA-binding response OmpR family regulator